MRSERKITISQNEIAYITENYGNIPTTQIAKNLKIGLSKVWKNIKAMNLIKSNEKQLEACNGWYNEKNFIMSLEVP